MAGEAHFIVKGGRLDKILNITIKNTRMTIIQEIGLIWGIKTFVSLILT